MMNPLTKIFSLFLLILLWISLNGINFKLSGILLLIIIPLVSWSIAFYIGVLPAKMRFKLSFILYFFWLIKEIIKSTLDVIKIIWRTNMNLSETFEWIEASRSDEILLTVYGNSITLTPGTVTLDVKDNMLLIHSLMKPSIEELKKGEMENRIKGTLFKV